MSYVSTRGEAPKIGFSDAFLAGLARDGGLYVPETMPTIAPAAIGALAGAPYAQAAAALTAPFVDGELSAGELGSMARDAYAGFRHPATAPLVQIGDNLFVLELFHGPTLAFKDFAMQWLGRLMDHVLRKRGRRATISARRPATPGRRRSRRSAAFRRPTCSFSIRTGACPRCSAGR